MNLADIKRKPVVSMADGTKIGEVDDLVIDVVGWTVREVVVAEKTVHGILPLSHFKGVGKDAVTVENRDTTAWNGKASGLLFEDFKKLHVVDGSGTVIGHATDLTYEPSGTIASFEVRQGGVFGIGAHVHVVSPSQVRGVGDKIVTVEIQTSSPEASV